MKRNNWPGSVRLAIIGLMTTKTPRRAVSPWIAIPLGIAVAIVLSHFLNQPVRTRLDAARRDLAKAGYPDARVNRAQTPSNMRRCGVGQIRNKGYAYAWEADVHSGVFCQPEDGRPVSILLDR